MDADCEVDRRDVGDAYPANVAHRCDDRNEGGRRAESVCENVGVVEAGGVSRRGAPGCGESGVEFAEGTAEPWSELGDVDERGDRDGAYGGDGVQLDRSGGGRTKEVAQ